MGMGAVAPFSKQLPEIQNLWSIKVEVFKQYSVNFFSSFCDVYQLQESRQLYNVCHHQSMSTRED